jgi:DNA invertase Pin-like site-specific DNA recombinase
MLHIVAAFAEFERALIRERTKAGLVHARTKGKRLGRPPIHNPHEIRRLRDSGLSYKAISERLGAPMGTIGRALSATRKTCHRAGTGEQA